MGLHFEDADATCKYVRQQTDTVILMVSGGKNSLGAWLQLRRFWPADHILPVHMIQFPGEKGVGSLPVVERALARYEAFFGQRIFRIPHPSLYTTLSLKVYQPPGRYRALEVLREEGCLPVIGLDDYNDWLKSQIGLEDAWIALGLQAVDTNWRRMVIGKHGSVYPRQQKFYPTWNWSLQDLAREIEQSGAGLSEEYRLDWYGRSLSGMDARFSSVLKAQSPADYAIMKWWYPLLEFDHMRLHMRAHLLRAITVRSDPEAARRLLDRLSGGLGDGLQHIASTIAVDEAKYDAMSLNTDAGYWAALIFQSYANKEAFFHALNMAPQKYASGELVAAALGIKLPIPQKLPEWRKDARFARLTDSQGGPERSAVDD